ncbi:threonine synthase [Paenibacillus cymbidii]|uniref:threonine synthase n=1 Tax=Paenibacillus cymbidii TaxID=1639034 RepID=UPI001080294E|nr:threonine synthase [Paenibacillus cymbidii]
MKCRLLCVRCAKTYPFQLMGKCECGGVLLVDYDLERAVRTMSKSELKERPFTMWRYRELLPVHKEERIVSLGEGGTPLIRMHRLEEQLSLKQVWVKREEQNPTGSFKARGMSVAVSLLHERGAGHAAVPSNGNAASALAAYAARAGMKATVALPRDCPAPIIDECRYYGAAIELIDGLIHQAGERIELGVRENGWYHVGTMKEPGRVEGKKTMGYEVAEQLGWKLPDVIVYPTGGGSGVIGMWKAFRELQALGWVNDPMPRFVCVQEEGCVPVVEGFAASRDTAAIGVAADKRRLTPRAVFRPTPNERVTSQPTGMRVPAPPDGGLIVSIVLESQGSAMAVSATEIAEAQRRLAGMGVSASPEGAATLAGLLKLAAQGCVTDRDRVVLFNTAHAQKYGVTAM